MLDILAEIYDDGGRLISVRYALFEGELRFITAVELQFESMSAVFRAVADDDTLTASLGPLKSELYETLVEVDDSELSTPNRQVSSRGASNTQPGVVSQSMTS